MKEQETRLTFHQHDDDDDDEYSEKLPPPHLKGQQVQVRARKSKPSLSDLLLFLSDKI
jgi:hypothetical protein